MRACACLLLLLSLSACAPAEKPTGELQLTALRGQWVFINYWATWCKPCIQEIPELNHLDEQYPDITVLGVNYDGVSGAELAQQVQQLGIAFTILDSDPAATLGVPRPVVLPTTLVLDPTGTLSATLVGPQTMESLALVAKKTGQ